MIKINKCILVFVFFSMISCQENTYENYYSFENNEWHSDSVLVFEIPFVDTIKKHDIKLKIRHTVDYDFQNLFVFLEDQKIDTIEIMLANKNGEWIGKGISDVREVEYIVEKKRVFSNEQKHVVKLEQAMRYGNVDKIEKLHHVLNIGLIVSENNE